MVTKTPIAKSVMRHAAWISIRNLRLLTRSTIMPRNAPRLIGANLIARFKPNKAGELVVDMTSHDKITRSMFALRAHAAMLRVSRVKSRRFRISKKLYCLISKTP